MSYRMRQIAAAFVLLTLYGGVGSAHAQRLDSNTVPSHYDLAFDVDLAQARFSGVETIAVDLKAPSRRIVLHALDLQFQDVTIEAQGQTQRASTTLDGPTETAALVTARPIPAGPARIHVRFTGILNDKLRGFYLSKANNRRYAVTQLESTDARRAFPCFDEPAYKATFSVSLTIDAADTAIANGQLLWDAPGPGAGRHTLVFTETAKMSSYLVAMAIGDFQCVSGQADATPIRICATPDKHELGQVALDAAKQILTFYNRYYSVKYPFGKLDVVAVPDFAAGAMENTGAIFYREVDLLADSRTASVASMKRIWEVLAHEMAHQWFGDLVTMRWWDDLWLNEGFATWMEKRPMIALKPEWKVELDEVGDTHVAMSLDSLASTRSIHTTVETPAEIEGSFDRIAYEKGASVMRMIEGYVGADVFRTGVNAYLEKHAYGNATSEDFWRAMTAASGKPVDRILPTFVNQPGVPLVNVAQSCSGGTTTLTLVTQRFLTSTAAPIPRNPLWQLPICVKTPTGATTCQVVSDQRATISLPASSCAPWAFINAGATGYYRTAYAPEILRAMNADIAARFTDAERLTLVGDEWALVSLGTHSIAEYMTLVSGFVKERASGVLDEIAGRLAHAHAYLTTTASREAFERRVRQQFGSLLFDELTFGAAPDEDDDRRALRATVIELVGVTGNDPSVSTTAQIALERSMRGGTPLDATAADAIVRVAAITGDAGLWGRLLDASKSATSPAEQYRDLYALPMFRDPALVDRGLNLALTPELRSQDTASFLGRFLRNSTARPRAWAFIKQHWDAILPKISISLGDVRLVESLGAFCDPAARDDVRSFFAAHQLPAATRALDQTLERINNCIALKDRQSPALTAWLLAQDR
ncbi:MAG: M1 family metallopeptidase [Vicinamibacterales bacterium]